MDVTVVPAVNQLAMLREGKISQAELLDEHIRRIKRLNPVLNALVEFDEVRVRAEAAKAKNGPLAGLAFTVKSSIEVAGYRCEIGSSVRKGLTATKDANSVAALRGAGAVVLGTTNCPEFLMAYETDNLLSGQTRNPWDLTRSSGGSSGGEAAAIAAGLSAGGLGSDSGGSVREPAHFTGICALKPTPGRVSAAGHMPPCLGPFSSLGAVGPMARTIADVDLLFQVLVEDAFRTREGAPTPYRPLAISTARRARIGWFEDDTVTPVTPETRRAIQSAVRELQMQGFDVQPFRPAGLDEVRKLWRLFFLQCGAMLYSPVIDGHEGELSPIFREFLREASVEPPLSATALLQAWTEMDRMRTHFAQQMQTYPLLLTPVCAVPAFRHGERSWHIEGQNVGYWDAMRFTQWFNLLALPAAVVPVAHSENGLPVGVQLVGRAYEDELVLTVAGVLDRAFGYSVPPLAR